MPAKVVVYGKKRNGERTAFTKFLSPEKEAANREIADENATSGTARDRRRPTEPEGHDMSVLEQGLGKLRIEKTQPMEDDGTSRKRSRSRKAKPGRIEDTVKENVVPFEDVLELSMQALSIQMPKEDDSKLLKEPRKPRKVLSDRNINALKNAHELDRPAPKLKKEKKRAVPIAVAQDVAATPIITPVQTDPAHSKQASIQRTACLPTPEPTPEPADVYTSYASPLLALSDRKKVIEFQEWSDELAPHFEVTKIAEASFSEVYRLSAISPANGVKEESVLKVVALKTPPAVPLPSQLHTRAVRDRDAQLEKEMEQREQEDAYKSQVDDVASEVKLLQNLTHIPGFTVFRDLTIVQGRPSASFNDAWKTWNKARPRGKKSEFPDPSKKASYDEFQLWAVVEMQDAGTDVEKLMETGGMSSIWEAWDVFWGVAISVGKAEEACRFEHRDLHLGNICVRSSRTGGDVMEPSIKDPLRRKLRFTGLDTTVIDYTLSRADILASLSKSRRTSIMSHVSSSTAASATEDMVDVAYLDLNKDLALFQGDASEEYQYEIYRYMRGVALFDNPLHVLYDEPFDAPHEEEEQEEEEVEEEPEQVPVTPRRSPRKNNHIRFDSEDEEPPAVRRSPRKHNDETIPGTEQTPEAEEEKPEEQPEKDDVWRDFHPKTNLVWLHFLLHKLLNHLAALSSPPHHISSRPIVSKRDEVDTKKVEKKALRLYKVLQRVSELLCPVALGREEGLSSAKELVVLALEERWVRVEDVEG
ncbi:serine/threonine-protein kinase haspin [Alternaria panax]|uniref:non-specific serine/threonine protein kinase n=1 Tax=Alternaria panax TaxID=48097 RepID=A0AAD4IFR5_9PLEO|nr:serine/threonine-protein kinase haspin [Alternaria panax]